MNSYIIRQYSQRRSQQTGQHIMVLLLERVKGQRPIQDVVQVPQPSQLDDWNLYEKHEGEMTKQTSGDRGFLDWKMEKAREKLDLEQWKRTMHLGHALSLAKLDINNHKNNNKINDANNNTESLGKSPAAQLKEHEPL